MDIYTTGWDDLSADVGSALSLGSWYQVGMTYDGANMIIYLNGSEIKRQPRTGNINVNTAVLSIGNATDNNLPFSGAMDGMQVYSRVLAPSEYAGLYANQNSPATFYSFENVEISSGKPYTRNSVATKAKPYSKSSPYSKVSPYTKN